MTYFFNLSTKTFLPILSTATCPVWLIAIMVLFVVALVAFFIYQVFEEQIIDLIWRLK